MKTDEIREKYLSFFEGKGCVRRPSDVLVPREDKTVLFTPAGMNQFKEQFMGINIDYTRATTCQKCLRTGDISNVGVTAYHHTFFEMLGNFSFGDYFKKEAIHWAWEFLTGKKWMNINPQQLTVSVYQGEHGFDEEAYRIWHEEIGLPDNRIAKLEEDENYWPASAPSEGPDGVCGPCSEIFFHPEGGKEVEIWNLVFTQFNRVGDPPDNLRPLPKKNIDTGMGLERMASVMQGVQSNFEIDTLKQLCLAAGDVVGKKYSFDDPAGRPLRRIADHVRAVTFAIHEGVMPDKEKENYVVRQLLRRAVLEGYLLGQTEPFLHQLVPTVVEVMQSAYPELKETVASAQGTIREEESQFLETIDRGLNHFESAVKSAGKSKSNQISGDDAFTLHTQEGFLIELVEAMASKRNLSVDRKQFNALMMKHKETSGGGDTGFDSVMAEGPLDAVRKTNGPTEFLGYDTTSADGKVVGIIANKQLVESLEEVGHVLPVGVILDRTPFYGEAGGQVGDSGVLRGEGIEFEVLTTQKQKELTLHIGHLKRGKLKLDQELTAEVISDRREGIRRAHTATHLLHYALHQTIGKDATQRGSKVDSDELRFDFAHGKSLSDEEIRRIEDIINERVSTGSVVDTAVMPIDEAKQLGAMALFGEKYPDFVRVVSIGDFSREFCGGTHLNNTGQVGLCKITSEEPVAKGVRRIKAFTGPKALGQIRETENLVKELVTLLKTPGPAELPRRIEQLQEELRQTRKEVQKVASQNVSGLVDELLQSAETVGDVKIVTHVAENITREALRDFVDQLRQKGGPIAILLGAEIDGKAALIAGVSKDLIKQGVKAGDAVKVAAKAVGGGGGGRPDMAEAGGKNPAALPDAIQAAADFYREKLGG